MGIREKVRQSRCTHTHAEPERNSLYLHSPNIYFVLFYCKERLAQILFRGEGTEGKLVGLRYQNTTEIECEGILTRNHQSLSLFEDEQVWERSSMKSLLSSLDIAVDIGHEET